jgi:hypothetical protein
LALVLATVWAASTSAIFDEIVASDGVGVGK